MSGYDYVEYRYEHGRLVGDWSTPPAHEPIPVRPQDVLSDEELAYDRPEYREEV